MANVYLEPIITDVRNCAYMASHPETFFKAMDDLKPYILTIISSNYARFKLLRDNIDLVNLRKKLECLNSLGYETTDITFSVSIFMGSVDVKMSDLVISWNNSKVRRLGIHV